MRTITFEEAAALDDQRTAHMKARKACTGCGSNQVQIMGNDKTDSNWRCRRCNHRWTLTLTNE
ncbi:hypothetical protein [Endozoicomonas ascidiicola]|uniref:hypothetical protein n=1 Tax=Endozoicomonas ascidiicola TaxID=1698521 RepID=UPI0008315436|nr:hypothetical protein [Endozoicomonas ascidiicola]